VFCFFVLFFGGAKLFEVVESVVRGVWREWRGLELPRPLERLPYQRAMAEFGSDKPDRRFGLRLRDVSAALRGCQAAAFRAALDHPGGEGSVRALNAKGLGAAFPKALGEEFQGLARSCGAKGVVMAQVQAGGDWKGTPLAKFLSESERRAVNSALEAQEGDLLLLVADEDREVALKALGKLRLAAAQRLQERGLLSIPPDVFDFFWVVDFPLFSPIDTSDRGSTYTMNLLHQQQQQQQQQQNLRRWQPTHHPFTAPHAEDVPLLDSNPGAVRGLHYDLVVNGVELGGGSIRIHNADLQEKVFRQVLSLSERQVDSFAHMLDALRTGCPPHGGIALGVDRMVAMLCDVSSIREVIAFPKSQTGRDLTTGAPAPLTVPELAELGLQPLAKK
jgi:aspartyl-tRNA synthetase